MLRHRLAVLFLLGVFFSACHKKNMRESGGQDIIGTWELRQTLGSAGATDYPPGNGHLLRFDAGSYYRYVGGQLQISGVYTVVPDAHAQDSVCLVLPAGQFGNRVIYDNNDNAIRQFFQIDESTLTFIGGCFAYDAGSQSIYARTAR
ncbi:MAG TPA: hypothetical protein VNU72_06170 [Puia sp.]|nr:hypothetical protein [Puia sp.]